MKLLKFLTITSFFFSLVCTADDIITNEVIIRGAPKWLKTRRVERVVEQIQKVLEWDIRRINVKWYNDQSGFEAVHGYGPSVLAVARKSDNTVHVGPNVTDSNFDGVFGHELVHVILFQKYHDAIPKWLEEGLANYAAKRGQIDYTWLASRAASFDAQKMTHPFGAISSDQSSAESARYHYMASRALVEMIASKCRLEDLIQLSTGKRLETYLPTFCGIKDLNAEFKKWLGRKAGKTKK